MLGEETIANVEAAAGAFVFLIFGRVAQTVKASRILTHFYPISFHKWLNVAKLPSKFISWGWGIAQW